MYEVDLANVEVIVVDSVDRFEEMKMAVMVLDMKEGKSGYLSLEKAFCLHRVETLKAASDILNKCPKLAFIVAAEANCISQPYNVSRFLEELEKVYPHVVSWAQKPHVVFTGTTEWMLKNVPLSDYYAGGLCSFIAEEELGEEISLDIVHRRMKNRCTTSTPA